MRDDQIQASVPAPVASLPPREPMPTVHFSMARSVHFSMAIDRSKGRAARTRSSGRLMRRPSRYMADEPCTRRGAERIGSARR